MQLRSMVDKEKENNRSNRTTHHDGERSENTDPSTSNLTHENDTEIDDIYRAVRVSNRGVRMFWYIPDLRNTQLRNIADARLPHPNEPLQILIKAPELRRFFKTSTFEICIDNGRIYTYTDPKVDIGVGLADEPFELGKLEEHLRELTKVSEFTHQMERIPLMERTTPTTEVMALGEFENNVGKFFKLCKMYGETSCELARRSSGSEEETAKAYDTLHPYICDILEQIEKGHTLFRIEREVRYQKGRGKLRIPYITPKEIVIVNAKQLKEFKETVDDELTSVIESMRAQEEEFGNRVLESIDDTSGKYLDKVGRLQVEVSKEEESLERKRFTKGKEVSQEQKALDDYYDAAKDLCHSQKVYMARIDKLSKVLGDPDRLLAIINHVQLPAVQVTVTTREQDKKQAGLNGKEMVIAVHLPVAEGWTTGQPANERMIATWLYFVLYKQVTGSTAGQDKCAEKFGCSVTQFK